MKKVIWFFVILITLSCSNTFLGGKGGNGGKGTIKDGAKGKDGKSNVIKIIQEKG